MNISKIARMDLKDSIIKAIVVHLYAKIVSIKDLEKIIIEFNAEHDEIGDK